MKITFLGTGTSQGVPPIGCDSPVCRSTDSKDKRLRASILVEWKGKNFVVDAGPDFRYQLIRAGVNRLDALLFTHEHRDHTAGLDDVRPLIIFNPRQWMCIVQAECFMPLNRNTITFSPNIRILEFH